MRATARLSRPVDSSPEGRLCVQLGAGREGLSHAEDHVLRREPQYVRQPFTGCLLTRGVASDGRRFNPATSECGDSKCEKGYECDGSKCVFRHDCPRVELPPQEGCTDTLVLNELDCLVPNRTCVTSSDSEETLDGVVNRSNSQTGVFLEAARFGQIVIYTGQRENAQSKQHEFFS